MKPSHETAIEAAALAMKAALGRQLNARPLLGDKKSDDWYADGGEMNFTELAEIALAAYRLARR